MGNMKKGGIAKPCDEDAKLKRNIRAHFTRLGFAKASDGSLILPGEGKEVIRRLHAGQRKEKLKDAAKFLERSLEELLPNFADGSEIDPSRIRLRLVRCRCFHRPDPGLTARRGDDGSSLSVRFISTSTLSSAEKSSGIRERDGDST